LRGARGFLGAAGFSALAAGAFLTGASLTCSTTAGAGVSIFVASTGATSVPTGGLNPKSFLIKSNIIIPFVLFNLYGRNRYILLLHYSGKYVSRNHEYLLNIKQGHKMFKKLLNWFQTNTQSELENFINSKRPTNSAEVDFWIRQYSNKKYGGLV
jgi:hypothetical protein